MILYKHGQSLSKKDQGIIEDILLEYTDPYGDNYITKDCLRLYLQENPDLLFDVLKKGDKLIYSEEDGMILITGWSDSFPRKYIKILSKDNVSSDRLLKVALWNVKCDLWAKVKKENPIKIVLQKNGFKFAGSRGKEILLKREGV